MQGSRISEFTIHTKATPQTAIRQHQHETITCPFCAQNLALTTQLRKREIVLELQIQKLKEQITLYEKRNQELIHSKVITYHEYQQKLEKEQTSAWNKEDSEAELFQLRLVNQLLLLSKTNHPQIKTLTDQSLKQKYADLVIENIRMQEKIQARDRVIAEKECFPLYHYDQRITTLRKAVAFWYRKAEQECSKVKAKCRQAKVRLEEESIRLREQVEKELEEERDKLMRVLESLSLPEQVAISKKKAKKVTTSQSLKDHKKPGVGKKSQIIRIFR